MNILILNSAHGKYPVGSEGWVQATAAAVSRFAGSDAVFVCSTDPLQWDLETYLAGVSGAYVRLIVKHGDDEHGYVDYERLKRDFALADGRTTPLFLPPRPTSAPSHPKDTWQERDRMAVETADEVYPISLRPNGRLDSLLREPAFRGKVRNDFRIPWSPNNFIPRYSLDGRSWRRLPAGEWLVHWTRSNSGKWPGERDAEFFRDLLADGSRYVRDAGSTLCRMLSERRVRSSAWRMPGGVPAVSFSALSPGEAVELMRWRKRYVRMSFEPYGIAVEKKVLLHMGAREVSYIEGERAVEEAGERLFTQSAGDEGRWAREREWRLPGDLDLAGVPADSARVVVPDAHAADILGVERTRGFPVHVLFDG